MSKYYGVSIKYEGYYVYMKNILINIKLNITFSLRNNWTPQELILMLFIIVYCKLVRVNLVNF